MDKLADIKFIETALELRRRGKTQREVEEILGVPRRTISDWENTSNGDVAKASIPDLRTSVPRKERPKIYERTKRGDSQEQIASDSTNNFSYWENISNGNVAKANIPDLRTAVYS